MRVDISEEFEIDDIPGTVSISYDPEPMFHDDTGTGTVTIKYDDVTIKAKPRNGRTPVLSFSSDNWGRTVERVGPTDSLLHRPIPNTYVEEIEQAVAAVDEQLGYVEVDMGPETTTTCRERVDDVIDYEINRSAYGSQIIGPAKQYDWYKDTVLQFDDRLEPLLENDELRKGWYYVMHEAGSQ